MKLAPSHPDYPASLRTRGIPPVLTLSKPLPTGARTVAIVGSRRPLPDAKVFAKRLAARLAGAGITIISGGAIGVDAAAHEAALDAIGSTWVVCGTGRKHVYPEVHHALYERVEASEMGRMIWPFDDDVEPEGARFRERNGVLVGLADVVVVVQARRQSGSRNAATWARDLKKPLWVVPGLPWAPFEEAFSGCTAELVKGGAMPLTSMEEFCKANDIPAVPKERPDGAVEVLLKKKQLPSGTLPLPLPDEAWTSDEKLIFSALSLAPQHIDQISQRTCLAVGSAVTALLTLSMKDVVVEGPDGFFRRQTAG